MRYMQPVRVLAICLAVGAIAVTHASAALVGGTYTNGGAPTTSWPAVATATASPLQYKSMTDPTSATTAQGFHDQDSNATGAIMSEVVTPATTFTLDTITVEWAGAAPTPSGQVSLHLYTLGTASTLPDLANSSSAFYFAGTDLLGGGTGLPFSINGLPGPATIVNFTLDNTGTSDKVTLTAGTSYAVEFWNQTQLSGTYSNTPFTWLRSAGADPGGQLFTKPNTNDFGTSRNTLAANGQAGGSPRLGAIALYGTSAAAGVTGDYNNNGVVDAADYAIWRENSGQSVTIPNDPTPGTVTQADYDYWKAHFSATSGAGAGLSSGGAVPEPSTIVLAVVGIICVGAFRRRNGG